MGVSVLGMPDAGALSASDWLYILQGTGLDRDRKATLSKVREYCTSAGVTLYELNTSNAVGHVLALALGSASTSAFVVVSGSGAGAWTLNISGSTPAGCQVNVLMMASGTLKLAATDATINGIDSSLTLTVGDSALLGRGTGTVWWGSATRSAANTDAAVLAETQRAEGVETSFSQSLSSEANTRSEADSALGLRVDGVALSISNETTNRESAISSINEQIATLAPSGGPGEVFSLTTEGYAVSYQNFASSYQPKAALSFRGRLKKLSGTDGWSLLMYLASPYRDSGAIGGVQIDVTTPGTALWAEFSSALNSARTLLLYAISFSSEISSISGMASDGAPASISLGTSTIRPTDFSLFPLDWAGNSIKVENYVPVTASGIIRMELKVPTLS